MWLVCTKTEEIIGFTLPTGVTDKEKCKPVREEYGQYDGWGSPYPDSSYEIILTEELHSKFPYLTYESEPLWVDFIDTTLERLIDNKNNIVQEEKICGNCISLKGTFCKCFGEYREPYYEPEERDCFEPYENL